MKNLLLFAFLTVAIISVCNAQQMRKADDALLLEYYQNQRFADALTYLKSVYTEPVTDLKELSRLAYTSAMAHRLPEAEGYYQQIYDKDTTNVSVTYNLAGINQRRNNNAKAEFYYKKLVVIDSTNFNAYNNLAQLYRDKSDLKSEVSNFEKANHLNPIDADVAFDLSQAYMIQEENVKAEKVLNIAIAADSQNILLQQAMLKLNYIQNKWHETVVTGEQLLLAGDSSISTISKLGRAYYQTKNYTCGIAVLTALPETNQTENTVYTTAICYKMLKDQKNAISCFSKAIDLSISKGTAIYYSEMADSYENTRQLKKAQAAYQKALLYDETPLIYYYLATLLDTKLNDKRNALKYFKKYLATQPGKKQQSYIDYSTQRITALSHK